MLKSDDLINKIKIYNKFLNPETLTKLLRNFYDRFTQKVGKPLNLAEDATIKDTSLQRTGEVWSEIRYDPKK